MSKEHWFLLQKKGKIRIKSSEVYQALCLQIKEKIDQNESVIDILRWIEAEVKTAYEETNKGNSKIELTQGAVNNCRGQWNEFLITSFLAEIAIDLYSTDKLCFVPFRLPSSKEKSKFLAIFQKKEFQENQGLHNINKFKDKIFFSSPDYVLSILDDKGLFNQIEPLLNQQAKEAKSLGTEIYQLLEGKLKAKEVKAALSVKISYRPDRRYQPLYETAMIKAIGYACNQMWKYYMITAEKASPSDLKIFTKGIAPHGIAIQKEELRSVDQVYSCSNKQDLLKLVKDALSRND
jgi:disulfide oxidoreductase YuzD